jgi:hypothetical protein
MLQNRGCLKHNLITEAIKSHPLIHVYHLVLGLVLKWFKKECYQGGSREERDE